MSIEAMKQALEALEESCGNRCNAEYNPCYARTAITSLRQAIEQAQKKSAHESELMMNDHNYRQKFLEKQEPLEFSRGWDAGYNYAGMRFKNNFEQYLRIAITAAVEKAGVETFRHFVNHYKNETCKEKTND